MRPPLTARLEGNTVSTHSPDSDRPAASVPGPLRARRRRPPSSVPASPPQSPGPRWAAFTTAVRAHRPVAHDPDVREKAAVR